MGWREIKAISYAKKIIIKIYITQRRTRRKKEKKRSKRKD
jgi:hypothetical protein